MRGDVPKGQKVGPPSPLNVRGVRGVINSIFAIPPACRWQGSNEA